MPPGHRPGVQNNDAPILGEDLFHDLRLFIEDVTDAANVDVKDVGQRVYSVDELSKHFNVSTKTISRWRQQ